MYPKTSYQNHKKQSGIGLPVALFVITVLALIVVAITDLEESSGVSFSLDVNSMRAFYAAESGAQIDMAKIFPSSGAVASCSSQTTALGFSADGLNGCRATVARSCVAVDGVSYFSLKSTGACGSGVDTAERVIVVRARQ
ncbi:hypothetical protein [Alkalimarinus alittae]|uniref:MSHA biogenesis protein MshP n=1 Tax=Alkalimarinus alittae TaxID=2961619 RepID=A0ABY6N120_9ALTE|nr:hypothetical protein [Alkalimarinus alittae]UZE95776.1 hypothetical protein NKI27_17225 [Alkalimarinus alittae]